jgi:glyoxylase-like metal-dependent hydrolase (beta-lactamase superfamily II)
MTPVGKLVQVEGPVWMVLGEGHGRFPRSHSVLIRDRETVLIDTGPGLEVLRELRETVRVDRVLNTHAHPDHAAGNFLFADREVLVPAPALDTAGDLVKLSERFFVEPEVRGPWREFVRREMGFQDQRPTGAFSDGDELSVGDTRLVVVHTPGHSVDHCCFWLPDLELLVGADIDLTAWGPWYGHVESDLGELRSSVERVKALRPRVLVSSHRPPVRRDVLASLDTWAAVLGQREARLLDFLATERTWNEIVEAALVYGRFPYVPDVMRSWEGQMIGKHLAEVLDRGAVTRTERGFVARTG